MARTITVIHRAILDDISANETLAAYLTSTSVYAIYRAFCFVIASAIWLMETFFDQHVTEVNAQIQNQKSGRKPWYRDMALKFQYGFDLVPDKDYFDNGIASAEDIEDSKIIKYAAVSESEETSRVILKIAGETEGVLAPITTEQYEAFDSYINEIRWAGVQYSIINYLPDQLYLNIQIKRDALVLNANGISILNGNYPVVDAIQDFMKELPFNGELRLSALVDKLQKVTGVIDATILSAQSAWINPDTSGYGIPQPIFISKIAESGYYEVVNYDTISYVV